MAAGGTGGHVFPALSLAKAFEEKVPGVEIRFVGTPGGFENTLVPAAGYKLHNLHVEGVKGKGVLQKIKSAALLPKAFLKADQLLKDYRPDVVFGIGGYVSGPVMLLSSMRGVLTGVLEPNAVAGFSNRTLGRWVDHVFVAFEQAKRSFPIWKTTVSGNPIRKEILAISPPDFTTAKKTIFIFGGSQGAHKINQAVCEMLPLLASLKDRLSFIHQTGRADLEMVKSAYQGQGISADVREFIPDMNEAYAKSHIIVARSGSSVLEIAACGRPSILIPYPFAADDHQTANAEVLGQAGAAIVVPNIKCDGPTLFTAVASLMEPQRLENMSRQVLHLRRENAAAIIVETLVRSLKKEAV